MKKLFKALAIIASLAILGSQASAINTVGGTGGSTGLESVAPGNTTDSGVIGGFGLE